jgi:hypothetical protein
VLSLLSLFHRDRFNLINTGVQSLDSANGPATTLQPHAKFLACAVISFNKDTKPDG